MRRENRKDDAVSPVIGVMLMLVVTIVIAAVVVMFSTGLTGDTKTTPTAMFEVSNAKVWNGGDSGKILAYVNLRHKGGDVIPLSDLKVSLENVGGAGFNNGIIQAFTASDLKSKIDLSEQEWTDGSTSNSYYQQQKQTLETKQAELVTFLESKFDAANVTKYSEITSQYSNEDPLYGELEAELKSMGMSSKDIRNGVKKIIQEKRSALNGIAQVESEGWIIENGEVLGMYTGGSGYPISVLGQEIPTESTVSTGEIIHVVPYDDSLNSEIPAGTTVKWTISYIPTNSIIAKGEFEVIAD